MISILLMLMAVAATSARVLGLVAASIVTGWLLSYYATKNRTFESIFIAAIEVFESIPVISFFPVVLAIFIIGLGGTLGVELSTDFLVFTAVVWNIWIGEYQGFKTVPNEMLEVSQNFKFNLWERLRYIFVPFSVPRISANLFPSISDGFFYITVSEVFAVGIHKYSTFGVGTVLNSYVAAGLWRDVALTFVIFGIVIVLIVLGLRELSNRAVGKYALDTDMPIVRRGRLNLRESLRYSAIASVNPLNRLARYNRARRAARPAKQDDYYVEPAEKKYGYLWAGVGILILSLIGYGVFRIVTSISAAEWGYLFESTPGLLLGLLYDYVRVTIITVVAFVLSVFVGYALAVHKRAESVGIPVIEAFSAYPVPTYFPFLFLAAVPFVSATFGQLSNELFVLVLGFISTFYYVFYSFWMGIKAMPSEYNEIMRNLNLGFFMKMRRVILPSTFPYLISGVSSTINSAWGGLMIGEYWPAIIGNHSLLISHGLMKSIDVATRAGNISLAAWASFLFGIVVTVYSLLFTRNMMDLARKKYVSEEGIYSA